MQDSELLYLFDKYANMVYRLALSYLRNTHDAEDTVQAVFIKLIEGKAQIVPGKERALLTQITINHCKDQLRLFWRRRTEQLEDHIEFVEKEDKELFRAVMSLPEKYRIVVYLHYYEGYSFSEISSFLGISPSAVSMRLHRSRNSLKSKLKEEDYGYA
ncbi:sigma-70 family RNA polymerase sigma factor [Pseudoclostridium thermosuccinogenes]|jgi:RNA polymerase sigma-70 factor (ECF subfamily)|uniref:RNA polymerase sigma factor n=1 Tax=Clostridium thermosuccinogenes TaxID=84032 RepID=UPI002FD96E60